MEIGIIHLTDLHISDQTNLPEKIKSLCQVAKNEFSTIDNRYLVISGDIVSKGKRDEYNIASDIISNLENELDLSKIIIVPGNHDCNFDYNNQIRINCIANPDYENIGDDGSVIYESIKIQKDFWSFYERFNTIPDNKLSYKIIDNLSKYKICFHCFNTAWMSQIEEKPGTLFFPVRLISDNEENSNDLDIAVFHHPISWFSPNKNINNKNEFQEYLDEISTIKLIGHEHENKSISRKSIDNNNEALEFFGHIFNNNSLNSDSGFQVLRILLNDHKLIKKTYEWEEDLFVNKSEHEIPINSVNNKKLRLKESFKKEIDDIKIPFSINKKSVYLSSIYVFPDLEKKDEDITKLEDYIDSEQLLQNNNFKRAIIDGESQIGKTSLLYILFQKFYRNGFYPILLNGKNINKPEINKLIKKIINNIYTNKSGNTFDRFLQIEKTKKVLLIDDFHNNNLSSKELTEFIHQANDLYETVIITLDSASRFSTELQTTFSSFYKFTLKPLGYKKTDDLIWNYFSLKEDFLSLDERLKLSKIQYTFDQVRNLLGDKILPSYPIFILTLLRTLDEASYSLHETSYGYCYESLLYFALRYKAGLEENALTLYLSFIEQLAYDQFLNKQAEFDDEYFHAFYNKYRENHIIDEFSELKYNLLSSYILKENDNVFCFAYKYIFYYLVAKHLSGIINKNNGKEIVKYLFANLHHEENANILVFITHHTKDTEFIEESVLQAMEPFEEISPISLEKDCNYYKLLETLASEVTREIINADIDPMKNREENLIKIDNKEKTKNHHYKNDENYANELNEHAIPYIKAFKAIDIVSQIIKNRIGYLTKRDLIDYISELYLTGFRMIGAVGESFNQVKEELANELIENILSEILKRAKNRDYLLKRPIDRREIEKKVNKFFQVINLEICLRIFSKLIDSAGLKDEKMKEIYTSVANKINTPAAKLVSFSIKSYYHGASAKEIKDLADEFEKNPVALKILKARVIAYVYNTYIEIPKKQQIASILNLEFAPRSKTQYRK